MNEYRARLIEAVKSSESQQEVLEMTDWQLEAVIAADLGLPPGTTFSDEQLEMIIKHQSGE